MRFIIIIGITLIFLFGGIVFYLTKITRDLEIKGTFNTIYHLTDNPNEQLIETDFFKMIVPKGWIHIFGGFGVEGDPYGRFWTPSGLIFYEYGFYSPSYQYDNNIYEYTVTTQQINRFEVNIAKSVKDETGISIYLQHEMKRPFTFYLDKAVTKNYNELIKAIETLEFKLKQ